MSNLYYCLTYINPWFLIGDIYTGVVPIFRQGQVGCLNVRMPKVTCVDLSTDNKNVKLRLVFYCWDVPLTIKLLQYAHQLCEAALNVIKSYILQCV